MRKLSEKELLEELDKAVGLKTVAYLQIREHISLAKALPDALKEVGKSLVVHLNDLIWYIDSEIDKIEKDPRFHYKTAIVQVNAPLALIQQDMESRMSVLKRVRELTNKVIKEKK